MRSPRTLPLVALIAAASFAISAPAQIAPSQIGSAGLSSYIYFRNVTASPTPSKQSKFLINGAGNVAYDPFPTFTANPTGQSVYPLGRQYIVEDHLNPATAGTIPTT